MPTIRARLSLLLFFVLLFFYIAMHMRLFFIEGNSMEQTLAEHEFIITNTLIYRLRAPERKDIIVFQHPYADESKKTYNIKRIIGLPNETVSITGGTVHIQKLKTENITLTEPYVTIIGVNRQGSVILSTDEYFVMSDNRSEKADSRTWGALKKTFIVGPVIFHGNIKFLYTLFNRLDELRKEYRFLRAGL
jgi:signal peptidase I